MSTMVPRLGRLVTVALLVAACTDGAGPASPISTSVITTTVTSPVTTLPSPTTKRPPDSTTTRESGESGHDASPWPLGAAPHSFAVAGTNTVDVVRGEEGPTRLEIPGVRGGVILDTDLIFAVDTSSGTWVWPTRSGEEIALPGAGEPVSLMIGPSDGDVSTWFHDARIVDERPTILYQEVESETEPIESRMMLFDIESGLPGELFDKDERRSDMSDEEAEAFIADAALFADRFAVVFGVGESTWLEWYDLDGEPIDSPGFIEGIEGTVLEIESAGERLALGVETELHRLITEVWIGDLESGSPDRSLRHDVAGESLAGLAFDGRYVTAGLRGADAQHLGIFVSDLETGETAIRHGPSSVILIGT